MQGITPKFLHHLCTASSTHSLCKCKVANCMQKGWCEARSSSHRIGCFILPSFAARRRRHPPPAARRPAGGHRRRGCSTSPGKPPKINGENMQKFRKVFWPYAHGETKWDSIRKHKINHQKLHAVIYTYLVASATSRCIMLPPFASLVEFLFFLG